jgi:hypothetical protein
MALLVSADVTRRWAPFLIATALVTAACSDVPHATFEPPEGFVPFVADSTDNVGLGNDIAVSAEGVPFVSYFGFEPVLEKGEVAPLRPVGSPFLPFVGVASVAEDGAWTQGAVAQAEEFTNVPVPFDPSLVESLKDLEPANANGTSIAVGDDGVPRVAWASNDGIWYGEIANGSSVQQVWKLGGTLSVAGAIGRPGIAVDGDVPRIAWTVNAAGGQEVWVATPRGEGWRQELITTISCDDCAAPQPTGVGITSSGPLVVFVDQGAEAVMAARAEGSGWVSETVADGVAGLGVSLDVTEGVARASYYTGQGSVELAVRDGASWSTVEVGDSGEVEPGQGNFAPTTGVTVDSEGTAYVAWADAEADTVRLARESEGGFQEVDTVGTEGGAYPSLAAGTEGRIYLSWYDVTTEDLLMGVLGGVPDILVAQPSPPPDITQLPGAGETCEPDGTDLAIGALDTSWDGVTCLAVEAGVDFTVTVENLSAAVHDFSIYPSADEVTEEAALFYSFDDPVGANETKPYAIDPIEEPGEYFFRCDFHPTTMTGTFVVA